MNPARGLKLSNRVFAVSNKEDKSCRCDCFLKWAFAVW
jgi:hypothetical protein